MERRGLRVLVVDDEPDLLATVGEILEQEGAKVALATGAADALRSISDGFEPVVILTDLTMPGWSGVDLVRELRADPKTSGIRIIAMSASSKMLRLVDDYADAQLQKPFEVETLVEAVAG
jgi:CheY-like chemotaxis protein